MVQNIKETALQNKNVTLMDLKTCLYLICILLKLLSFYYFFKDVDLASITSSRCLERQKIVAVKTSRRLLEDVLKKRLETSWRQTKCLLRISVSNKSKLASNNSIFHKCISDESKRIQNALIRTQ